MTKSILVVDDEASISFALMHLMKSEGYNVETASDASMPSIRQTNLALTSFFWMSLSPPAVTVLMFARPSGQHQQRAM